MVSTSFSRALWAVSLMSVVRLRSGGAWDKEVYPDMKRLAMSPQVMFTLADDKRFSRNVLK